MQIPMSLAKRPRVVIVGGGFGGLAAAKQLAGAPVNVTLIDKQNYHLFQPLLYQVATGGLSPANIAIPLRRILRKQKNCQTILGEVCGFDLEKQRLHLLDGQIAYDYLIVAAGAKHSYFGNDQWQAYAPGLKTLDDAAVIRRKIYLAFEAAEREESLIRQKEWLTFVVVGGGPTGVELAGAIAEIAGETLRHDFRRINPADARIVIVEAAPAILNMYPRELESWAAEKIESMGIELLRTTTVVGLDERTLTLRNADGSQVTWQTPNVFWAAGVSASPLGKLLASSSGSEIDRAGRVRVSAQLQLQGYSNIFVIGDLAAFKIDDSRTLPGIAPVAMQQGKFVGKWIARDISGKAQPEKFVYCYRGMMATLGRSAAIAVVGDRQVRGLLAWLLWVVIHLLEIAQFENRLLVFAQWGWNYLTHGRSARLITGMRQVRLVEPNPSEPNFSERDALLSNQQA